MSPVGDRRRKRYKSGNTYSLTLLCVHSWIEWLGKWMTDKRHKNDYFFNSSKVNLVIEASCRYIASDKDKDEDRSQLVGREDLEERRSDRAAARQSTAQAQGLL